MSQPVAEYLQTSPHRRTNTGNPEKNKKESFSQPRVNHPLPIPTSIATAAGLATMPPKEPITSVNASHTRDAPFGSDLPPQLIPRGYQFELFRRACKENVIAFLETGSGKTLVAALLIKKTIEDLANAETQITAPAVNGDEDLHGTEDDNESVDDLEYGDSDDDNNDTEGEDYEDNTKFDPDEDDDQDSLQYDIEGSDEDCDSSFDLGYIIGDINSHERHVIGDDYKESSTWVDSEQPKHTRCKRYVSRRGEPDRDETLDPDNGPWSSTSELQVSSPDQVGAAGSDMQSSSGSNSRKTSGMSRTPQRRPGTTRQSPSPPPDDISPKACDSRVNGGVSVSSGAADFAGQGKKIAVFLVHRVPLVPQQAKVVQSVMKADVEVGMYYGERCVDWSSSQWARSLRTKRVLVMTAQVFLNLLRHGLVGIRSIALLVLDEVHHATKNHPYRRLFLEFYHTLPAGEPRPRVFGMTATPVKAKAASQKSDPCLKAILALEATLDATVVTVSTEAQSEVEVLVPKPEEFIALFEGSEMNMELNEEEIAELETPSLASVMELVTSAHSKHPSVAQIAVRDSQLSDGKLEPEEGNTLNYLLWKLGFRAAAYFAKELCALKGICSGDVVDALLQKSSEKDIKIGGVTARVSMLLDILFSEYMRCKGDLKVSADSTDLREIFRCIVFVKERVTAVALAWLINSVFKDLKCPELSARSAVGVQNNASRVRMSQSKLMTTLSDFQGGFFGILVATSVVEEGLDVPACRLVVVCDAIISPSGYVQRRGRARKRGARYIIFLERGSEEAYNETYKARAGARMMSLVVSSEKAQDGDSLVHRNELVKGSLLSEDTLYSRTTRAQVTGTEAVNLLHRYNVGKAAAAGSSDAPKPEYVFTRTSTGAFTCQVQLHATVSIGTDICISPQETELNAKRAAALEVYSRLYEAGEVDEFLLPKRQTKKRARQNLTSNRQNTNVPLRGRRRSDREKQTKSAKRDRRVRKCRIAHPDALQSPYNRASHDPVSAEHVEEGPQNAILRNLPQAERVVRGNSSANADFLPDHTRRAATNVSEEQVEGQRMLMFRVQLDECLDDLNFLSQGTDPQFGILVKNDIPPEDWKSMRCPSGEDLISLQFEKRIPWNEEMQETAYKYVRSLQLCLRGRAPGSPGAMELYERDYSKNKRTGFLLLPLKKCENNSEFDIDWPSIEKLLCFGWKCGPLEFADHEQHLKQGLEHSLLCSYHESFGRVYLSGEFSTDLRASSSSQGFLNSTFKTFADYFLKKHDTQVPDEELNLIEGYIVLDKMCRLSASPFMLPPELCRIIPIPPIACYIASILPQWQTFLALRSCWRRNRICPDNEGFISFARALQPNINNIAKDDVDLSHERLEFLGDAVLKVLFSMAAFVANPLDSEGFLSDERDIEVSNQKLADLAIEMKIQDCVAFSGVTQKAKSWPWFWGTHQNKSVPISQKVLADCVEALIGAHYLQGGIEAAAVFMDKHKVLPGGCRVLGISEDGRKSEGALVTVPDLGPSDNRKDSVYIEEVEKIIGYQFRDRGHLVVALTHGSFRNGHSPSYQRYEYLGDAIIGCLLLSHLFDQYADAGPGDLTALRGPALSNDLFARVIVSLNIHERFWFECPPFEVEIKKFANLLANERSGEDVCKQMTVPKVLGDLLEAIIGAVVIDKGMKLDGVKDIVLALMHKELRRFCDPESFKHNPVSELVQYVQRVHKLRPSYKYYNGENSVETECAILVHNREVFRASGPTRRVAKHMAAVESLNILKKEQDGDGRILIKYDGTI